MQINDQNFANIADKNKLIDHDMIYFGPGDWDGLWRNRNQLMSRFARNNKVMYVEPVQFLRNMIKKRQSSWPKIKESISTGLVRKISNNLYVYNAPMLPIIGRYPINAVTWALWRAKFKSTLRSLGFKKPIIWLSFPTMGDFLDKFDNKLSIYHVVDEYTEYRGVDTAKLKEMERQILKKVDLAIVVSDKLLESKRPLNPNTYKIPNGVDYRAYNDAIKFRDHMPSDIRMIKGPILGYSGLISYRIDLNMIKEIALTQPQWSIVLIGTVDDTGCEKEIALLRQMPNVYFLGMKPIEQVPQYIVAFDICLIPYARNGEVENLSPLKLYDYMAAGKPIVTTDFPAANEFKELIYIANTPDRFLKSIKKALSETDSTISQSRRQAASQNTWEDRIAQISNLITTFNNANKSKKLYDRQ
jgi:glycosyltransferase involved in cell wall biosynthesis